MPTKSSHVEDHDSRIDSIREGTSVQPLRADQPALERVNTEQGGKLKLSTTHLMNCLDRLEQDTLRAGRGGNVGSALAACSRALCDWVDLLAGLRNLGAGPCHEIELVFVELLDPTRRPLVVSGIPHEDLHLLAIDLAAIWAHNRIGQGGHFYRSWRDRRHEAEHAVLDRDGCSIVLRSDSSLRHDLPVQVRLLEFMAECLLEGFGPAPEDSVLRIDPNVPLTAGDQLTLAWFRAENAKLHPRECVRSLARTLQRGIDALDASIALWVANSPSFDLAARRWGWHWRIDFSSPLDENETRAISQHPRFALTESTIGARSLVRRVHEESPGTKLLPDALRVRTIESVPIALLGASGKGKSALFTAWVDDAAQHCSKDDVRLHPRQDLQAGHRESRATWSTGKAGETAEATSFSWQLGFQGIGTMLPGEVTDFRGEDLKPTRYPPELLATVERARGLFFVIDDKDLEETAGAREQAAQTALWYAELIRAHRNNQGGNGRGLPIGLIINKADEVLGPDLEAVLGRQAHYRLLGSDVEPALFFVPPSARRVPEELGTDREARYRTLVGQGPFERLRQVVLQQPENNKTARMRSVCERLLDRFQRFFEAALEHSMRVEVFLTVAVPRPATKAASGRATESPMGVREPLHWWGGGILAQFLEHARDAVFLERKELEAQLVDVRTLIGQHDELAGRLAQLGTKRHSLELKLTGRGWLLGSLGRRAVDALDKDMVQITKSIQGLLDRIESTSNFRVPSAPEQKEKPTIERARFLERGMQDRWNVLELEREKLLKDIAHLEETARAPRANGARP